MIKRTLIFGLLLLALIGCSADKTRTEDQVQPYDFSYSAYAALLGDKVSNGLVDYASIKAERSGLDSLVKSVATADLSAATADQRLAFYINAYNILTLRSIIDAYPVESIKDIDGVWDDKTWPVAGSKITLNDIEHEILRKEFDEPRIHIAINCASIGCPPLLELPYYPEQLDSLLSVAARRFALSTTHNQIDPGAKTARLSAIFDWFGDDFKVQYYQADKLPGLDEKKNAALGFIFLHLPAGAADELWQVAFKVSHLDYDWSLNDFKR
jgi:hypothetical protein